MTRRLTVDYGMRFSRPAPYRFPAGDAAAFVFDKYNPNRRPELYQSVLVNGQRVARNPVTGAFGPAVLIGAYVPGTGDVTNGMVTARDAEYQNGFTKQQPIQHDRGSGSRGTCSATGRPRFRGASGSRRT